MNFASYEQTEGYAAPDQYGEEFSFANVNRAPANRSMKLFTDKFLIPTLTDEIDRPRLVEQTEKSLAHFSATIITGRAGTGKTVLATQFAAPRRAAVIWYKVETADSDWKVFASYLAGSLDQADVAANSIEFDPAKVSTQSETLAARFAVAAEKKPVLLVIDDLHSVFDAHWFGEFFNSFVPSLTAKVSLLLAARTLPPLAVWRLRSKQVLGVVEEKSLTFTLAETVELFQTYQLSPEIARTAHQVAYGKISKLKEIAEKKSALRN